MTQTEIKAAEMVKQYYHLIHGPDDDFEFTMKSNQFVSGGVFKIATWSFYSGIPRLWRRSCL